MPLISRGTIRSYDVDQHRASVQIAGSLATYITGLRVGTGIPAAAVVTDRECSVLFHTEGDPADAVVISVQGANPPTAGGDVSGPASSTDNAIARFDGTDGKTLQNSGPRIDDNGNLGVRVAPSAANLVNIGGGAAYTQTMGLHIGLGTTAGAGSGSVTGVGGYAVARTSGDNLAQGLNFGAGMNGIDLANANAIRTDGFVFGSGRTLTEFAHHRFPNVIPILATIGSIYGLYFHNQTNQPNRRHIYGLDITDTNSPTIARFLEFEDALIVKCTGEHTPADDETPVWIGCDAAQTMNQVTLGAADSGGSGYRVLRVPN